MRRGRSAEPAGWPRLLALAALIGAGLLPLPVQSQSPTSARQDGAPLTFRTEAREVLVEAVVRDRDGRPVPDLRATEFRLLEDGEPVAVTAFSREAPTASPEKSQPHYMVLFFDNSTLSSSDQIAYRRDAARFASAWAGPGRYMAAVNSFGALEVAQDFTTDPQRLARAIGSVRAQHSDDETSTAVEEQIRRRGSPLQNPDCTPVEIVAGRCNPNVPPPMEPRDPNPALTRAVFNGLSRKSSGG